jgi:hypothetical protein
MIWRVQPGRRWQRADRVPHLAHQALDQVSNGHAGGDGVGVDDDVRHDALLQVIRYRRQASMGDNTAAAEARQSGRLCPCRASTS